MRNLISFLIFVFFIQSSFAQSNKDKEIEMIRSARKASNDAIVNRDFDGIIKPMTDDIVNISGNGRILLGKDSIVTYLKQRLTMMPDLVFVRTPFVIRISNNDTLAWEKGTWKGFRTDRKKVSTSGGNYAAIWCKRDGVWKTHSEMYMVLTSNYPY